MPNFFRTLFRRKLVIWFLISEVLRDYWLSGPYGRNWQFLWAGADVPKWVVVVEIAVFFVGIWGLFMGLLIRELPFPSLYIDPDTRQATPRYIHGSCPSSRLVLAVRDGVRCGGGLQAWGCTFPGLESLVITCEFRKFQLF